MAGISASGSGTLVLPICGKAALAGTAYKKLHNKIKTDTSNRLPESKTLALNVVTCTSPQLNLNFLALLCAVVFTGAAEKKRLRCCIRLSESPRKKGGGAHGTGSTGKANAYPGERESIFLLLAGIFWSLAHLFRLTSALTRFKPRKAAGSDKNFSFPYVKISATPPLV